jgi:hypothetical protein
MPSGPVGLPLSARNPRGFRSLGAPTSAPSHGPGRRSINGDVPVSPSVSDASNASSGVKADQGAARESFTNLCLSRTVRSDHPCDIVGVIEAGDDPELLIGLASQVSSLLGDLAIWRLEARWRLNPGPLDHHRSPLGARSGREWDLPEGLSQSAPRACHTGQRPAMRRGGSVRSASALCPL